MKLSYSIAQLGNPISNVLSLDPYLRSETHSFKMLISSKKKKVPAYLDEAEDFVLACLRTCEGNLWETILDCIIQDDVLVGVAVLVANSP